MEQTRQALQSLTPPARTTSLTTTPGGPTSVAGLSRTPPTPIVNLPSSTPTDTPTATRTPTNTRTPTATDIPTQTPTPTQTLTPTATFTETPVPVQFTATTPILDPATREFVFALVVQSGENRIKDYAISVISEGGLQFDQFIHPAPLTGSVRIPIRDIPEQQLLIRITARDENQAALFVQELAAPYRPTPTVTPSATSTLQPTSTPTITPTEFPTITPTPTPPPVGSLPYINDMEAANALEGWDYKPESWSLVPISGKTVLVGSGGERDYAIVLGQKTPEWINPDNQQLLITASINLADAGSISRVVFRYSDKGYYVFQLAPGLLSVSRGQNSNINRAEERSLASVRSSINFGDGPYYQVIIWSNVNRTYVYVNRRLVLQADDTGSILPGGAILFQNINARNRVRYSNLKVQRPLAPSSNFQVADWPSAWQRSDEIKSKLVTDSRGNTYIETTGGDIRPIIDPALPNLLITCRLQSAQGGFEVRVRETAEGTILFDFEAGNLTISQVDKNGTSVRLQSLPNFWGRGQFFEFNIELLNGQILLHRGEETLANLRVDNLAKAGNVRFSVGDPANDIFRIDDCLFAEAIRSSTENAAWSFEQVTTIERRLIRDLLTDWYDDFDGVRTREWWTGGLNAPGEFKQDRNNRDHATYLEMTNKPDASYRLFRDSPTFYVFKPGRDTTRFADSSDMYLRVDVRIPGKGGAWIAVRTSASIGGGTLNGLILTLQRVSSNEYRILGRAQSLTYQPEYFNMPLPFSPDGTIPEWIPLLIVVYENKVAFFANGRFLGASDDVPFFSGTVAIGVEEGTTAHFDNFQLRDVSPDKR